MSKPLHKTMNKVMVSVLLKDAIQSLDQTIKIVISSTYSINHLRDDLKLMYNKAGVKGEGVMFLLADSQSVRLKRGKWL
jgi:hypothetical protein